MPTQFVFAATLALEGLIFLSLLFSIFLPARRIWPPPKRGSWQFWLTWITYTLATAGSLLLGVLDWDSFVIHHWLRYPIAALFIVGGLAFATWGIRTLGWHQSSGLTGPFTKAGPYRYSRNPQYVGDSLALLGYALLTNSTLVFIVNLLGILNFLITPFSEEPWLRARFGADYEHYLDETSRFLSLTSRR